MEDWEVYTTLTSNNGFWRFADDPVCRATERCEAAVVLGFMKRHTWPWIHGCENTTVVQFTVTDEGRAEVVRHRERATDIVGRAYANDAKRQEALAALGRAGLCA